MPVGSLRGQCTVKLEKERRVSPETPGKSDRNCCLNAATLRFLFFGVVKKFLGAILLLFSCQLTLSVPKRLFLKRTNRLLCPFLRVTLVCS